MAASEAPPRFRMKLLAAFAMAAMLIATCGIYGLMAYAVSRRTTEIGVRLAVGARPSRILVMVLAEASRIVGVGSALGLVAAFLTVRYVGSVLFGLKPTDPAAQAGGVVLLVLVACVAAFIPARRAARTDPLTALRHE